MKILFIRYLPVVLMLFGACSEVIVYEPDAEEIALYNKVYMPRANQQVTNTALSLGGEAKTFVYSAYLGGSSDAPSDIAVTFAARPEKVEEFNMANGTNYKLLPADNYTLEVPDAVIKAGNRKTGNHTLTVTPGNSLAMFENYILPLGITQAGTKVNEQLGTTYYTFSVSYARGEVPRELVLSMGTNWGNIICNGVRGSLIIRNTALDILVYTPDDEGKFTHPPRTVGVFWDASESFYYVNENSVVVRNVPPYAGLFSFGVTPDYGLPQANPFWLGDAWNQYVIIPFGEYFLTVDNRGVLRRQPVLSNVNAAKTEVGSGFIYKQVLTYQNSLLALEPNGNLWLYSMSELAVPGARRRVGEGWDMYEKIIVSGDDILALDSNGDVYRYNFNPLGYYPVK